MSSYDDGEATTYDASRGGLARARDAASAVAGLAGRSGRLLDVGGGTGIVSAALADLGFTVVVLDLTPGMLAQASPRLTGRVLAPGGLLITTVDKVRAHDRAERLADDREGLTATARTCGLVPAGRSSFTGASPWGSATGDDPVFEVAAFRRNG